eukprot:CAMPEP_0117687044 /NCGR_PEP_ID=MMETSP0804-20121206/22886_1 /TAXON_ID=1074897 /ORGANISM="Tetraselmis astigmatica, Strain CCMP880" /LENGTH=157 /DNA_ID=CAMNT_0005499003 /DNA_START=144 /DNA_END=617 /DNA_ORIENTATION=-
MASFPVTASRTLMMGVPPQRFGRSSTLKWGGSVFPKRPATPLRALPQPSPEQLQQMKAAYEQAMKDPEQAKQLKAMQDAMKNPEYMEQMQRMAQMMQNQSLQEKMRTLKDDPEFADEFAAAQKEGMPGLMKLMENEDFLVCLYNSPRLQARLLHLLS